MPINIYEAESFISIAILCDEIWDLPNQIDTLEKWLSKDGKTLAKANYIADIGFDIRKEANGGGAVINLKIIKMLA